MSTSGSVPQTPVDAAVDASPEPSARPTNPATPLSSLAPAPSADAGGHGSGCEHCDGSVPHEHLDVEEAVAAAERALRTRTLVSTVLLLVVVLSPLVVLGVSAGSLDVVAVLISWAIGAVAWAVGTGLGVVLTQAAMAPEYGPDGAGVPERRPGVLVADAAARAGVRGLVLGAVVLAAIAPGAGWAATLLSPSGTPLGAIFAGSGWALASGIAGIVSTHRMRALLREPGEAGEAVRQAAIHGAFTRTVALGWLWHPLGVAVWGGLASVLPITLVLTTVLHVALTLGLAVLRTRRRAV